MAIAQIGGRAHVVSGHRDGSLRLWDALTGEEAGPHLQADHDEVTSLAITEFDSAVYIVSGSVSGTIRLWDAADGALVGELIGHGRGTLDSRHSVSVAQIGGGLQVVCMAWGGDVCLWEPIVPTRGGGTMQARLVEFERSRPPHPAVRASRRGSVRG